MNFPQKIKKNFFRRRNVSFLFLGFSIFFLFSLPLSVSAGVWDFLVGAITAVPALLIMVAMAFVLLLSQVFAFISGAILNWIISPSFVAISYTNPVDRGLPGDPGYLPGNPIIQVGLDITKNFVNLALVVILVYIAVAIALRLGETNAKRLFAKLILVALLVNFAPLLVGLIVDASNIVMNYFLKGIGLGISDALTQLSTWASSLVSKLLRVPTFAGQIGMIAQTLVMIALNYAIGLALLLFAGLFIFRYIAIWTIVILSPLAFVAWILPATKKYWDMWWNNLVLWSIIGIPLAFFLYLGARAFELLPGVYKQPITMPGFSPEVAGTFSQAFPYFVVVAFLYLGFALGLQTSAMGATSIISGSKKAGKWTGNRIWQGAKTWTEEKAQIREKVGGITKKWEDYGRYFPPARWFIPEKMRKYAEARPAIEEARKKLSIHGSPELGHRAAVKDIYGKDAAAALLELVERGDSNDWFEQHMMAYGISPKDKDAMEQLHNNKKYQEKMGRLLKISQMGGCHATILRGSPRLAEFAVDAGIIKEDLQGKSLTDPSLSREEVRKRAIERVVSEARPQHIKNWEEQDIQNKDVIDSLMTRGRTEWQAVSGVKRGHLRPLEVIGDMYTKQAFPGIAKEDLAKVSKEELVKTWEGFEKTSKEQGKEGIFLYLDSKRAEEQGWTRAKIIENATGQRITLPKKKRRERPGKAPESTTPGEAAGIT